MPGGEGAIGRQKYPARESKHTQFREARKFPNLEPASFWICCRIQRQAEKKRKSRSASRRRGGSVFFPPGGGNRRHRLLQKPNLTRVRAAAGAHRLPPRSSSRTATCSSTARPSAVEGGRENWLEPNAAVLLPGSLHGGARHWNAAVLPAIGPGIFIATAASLADGRRLLLSLGCLLPLLLPPCFLGASLPRLRGWGRAWWITPGLLEPPRRLPVGCWRPGGGRKKSFISERARASTQSPPPPQHLHLFVSYLLLLLLILCCSLSQSQGQRSGRPVPSRLCCSCFDSCPLLVSFIAASLLARDRPSRIDRRLSAHLPVVPMLVALLPSSSSWGLRNKRERTFIISSASLRLETNACI